MPYPQNKKNIINIGLTGYPDSARNLFSFFSVPGKKTKGKYSKFFVSKPELIEFQNYSFKVYDLTFKNDSYSDSHEEISLRNFITETEPDIIVHAVDSNNLERDLLLTAPLIEMNVKLVIALDNYDEFKKLGDRFDYISFGRLTGIQVIPTVGSKGKGLAHLLNAVISKFRNNPENPREVKINYGKEIERSIMKIENIIDGYSSKSKKLALSKRYLATRLIEDDKNLKDFYSNTPQGERIINTLQKEISYLKTLHYEDPSVLIFNARQGFIHGLLEETYFVGHTQKIKRSTKADRILLHKIWGTPVFLLLLWLMFQATFKIGQYPMEWIDAGVMWISGFLETRMPAGDLKSLLINGIIGGIGGIIRYIPNILILFLFISIMEDTAYMARAAFLMDKLMHKIGLHGKSFIPMVMGIGCNVPAILCTRIIENRNNRIITMLIIPFISCSARLPVYILIIGAFFPAYQGSILFGLYLLGILLAAFTAILLRKFYFRQPDIPFAMELPPYRIPTIKNTIRHLTITTGEYLRKIAGIILIASVITWGLGYYPKNSQVENPVVNQAAPYPADMNPEQPSLPVQYNTVQKTRTSYLEQLGQIIEPVISPLGFDWKMGVSLIAGIAGKEIVVSTLSVMVHEEDQDGDFADLGSKLKEQKYSNGLPVYTPLTALSFLIFILIYLPCLAVIVTIAKEAGSVWWSVFLAVYTTGLAWLVSFAIYQAGSLLI